MNEMVESFKPIFRMLGCAFGLVIVFRIFLLWWNSPKQKGKRGEKLVAGRLRKGLPDEYRILNDVYLPLPDGTTTQIDHIVVSQYGIFVVETKTYAGWIFGDEKSSEWTQSIYRKKSRFQNPMRQNYRHVCALADNLGIDKSYFHGVVAFTGDCTFKTKMPEGVVYSRRAAEYIRSVNRPIIKAEQVGEVASAIVEWQGTLSEGQIKGHVDNLKKSHSAVREGDTPRCPYCGGEMVLRKRRGDGKSFYGCKSYPKCRGIVNVE
ncbi:MAG: NERD domain-containing protein [Kiritimatiellae bacterium]|nr:NERD domain-containing protein [Kiritimatiellia bacterium]